MCRCRWCNRTSRPRFYGCRKISNRQFAIVFSKHIDFNIITNKIINRFNQAFNFNNINVNVNLWSYICCLQSSKNIATVNDVFDIIDFSLKEAKQNTKNSVVFASTDILEKRRREIEIIQAISKAIDEASFQVYYQPIYSVKEKRFTSAEALIRLKHEKYGFISPELFITAAEKNGTILQIGDFIFDEVCRFISSEELRSSIFLVLSRSINTGIFLHSGITFFKKKNTFFS